MKNTISESSFKNTKEMWNNIMTCYFHKGIYSSYILLRITNVMHSHNIVIHYDRK